MVSSTLEESIFRERYARQMILPGFGREGQERLSRSRVLLLGAGGLGSVSAQYLVRAGIGRLTIIDHGKVDTPDLNRQLLYTTEDIGTPKAIVAAKLLRCINPDVEIVGLEETLAPDRLRDLIADSDIVVDGLDSFPARMLANEACCRGRKIFVHGGILGVRGMASVVSPGKGPCLQCIYDLQDLTTSESPFPVLGPAAGTVACIQAMETMHILLGAAPSLLGRLILFNGKTMNFSYRTVMRKADCSVCRDVQSTPGNAGGQKQ